MAAGATRAAALNTLTGDVTSAAECAAGAKGCEAVINLVGIIREFPARGITFSRLHVEATRNMLAAAKENGIRRYLQMSALGSRPGAVSGYHQSKYAAEELVVASGLDYTIFRPSLIFGPERCFCEHAGRLYPQLLRSFRSSATANTGCSRLLRMMWRAALPLLWRSRKQSARRYNYLRSRPAELS